MTYREKYKQIHPDRDNALVHIFSCPVGLPTTGVNFPCASTCKACWDQQIPEEKDAEKRNTQ